MTALPRAQAQEEDPAIQLLNRMSPTARVGQLFIVTFPGITTDELSAIYPLLSEDRIGGVLLRAENGNIVNAGNTPLQVATLTNALQQQAREASQIQLVTTTDEGSTLSPYIPLLIAVEHEQYGNPAMLTISGTTPLPSPMAVGATWNPEHAETAGRILGQELSTLGINMLLGPSLDVLDTPQPGRPADLGIRSFGGDPYWVGQMGKAYIQGVHEGSMGQVAVIPSHFPGLGAADRPLYEEVSTIQKSLEQLKQIELAPFFAVAGAEDPLEQPDGLLVSHIRYRGFQGNIYASTKPVSFDPQALQQLLSLPELAPWRDAGGLTVAEELGVRGVRRFYDPSEERFNGLRIAREAFSAGNDLLILSHFALTDDWESQIANIRSTIAFFQERYTTDPSFQAQVDEAVLRILRLKLRLYDNTFVLSRVQVDAETAVEQVGSYQEQVAPIAQDAATLLSPPSLDLRPAPPAADENIVIFTHDRQITPCADCLPEYTIPPNLLGETLIRLYGPQATSQVQPYRISSFTFTELLNYLITPETTPSPEEGTPTPPYIETALQQADWVLFAMLDINEQEPQFDAVRTFLAEQTNLLRGKNVVVFAFDAPYYLDNTEIAKLSAYFGLYSHSEPFVEAAARALFDEFPFVGASPVSIAGINYSLITQTQPDPAQVIQLMIGNQEETSPDPIELQQGDALELHTSVILDQNGHPVPDGTPVEFIFTYPQEGLEHTIQVTSQDGVAQTTLTLDRVGQLQISVRAEPVPRAVRLELDIREGESGIITLVTPIPSPLPQPTPGPPTIPPTVKNTPEPAQEPAPVQDSRPTGMGALDLIQALGASSLIALISYIWVWQRQRNLSTALQGALWCLIGGLISYVGLILQLPGTEWAQQTIGAWATLLVTLFGASFPLLLVLLNDIQTQGPLIRE